MSKQSMFHLWSSFLIPRRRSLGRLLLTCCVIATTTLHVQTAVPALVSGDGHYLALTASGVLYSWGRNDFGQLGLGGRPPSAWGGPTSPAIVPPPRGSTWAAIGAGDNHSLAISSDGSLWAWGRNDLTQLSFWTSLTRRWVAGGFRETSPVRISADKNWVAVSGGMLCSFALKRDGSLWAWGGNWAGQLGDGTGTFKEFSAPVEKLPQRSGLNRIGRDSDWARVSAGSEHVLAQKRDGTLWAWGRNECGQLGLSTYLATNRPVRISADTNWIAFGASGAGQRGAWSAAIKRDGTLWVWGNWKRLKLPSGSLNHSDTNMAAQPLKLGADSNWVQVACGKEVGAAVKADGTLWTWGNTAPGSQLPEFGITPRPQGIDHDWSQISADALGLGTEGNMHALKTDRTVWTWNPQILAAKGIPQPASLVSTSAPHQILRLREFSQVP
jgi:alpha-tubulin suppressor-like RCC1 family protein